MLEYYSNCLIEAIKAKFIYAPHYKQAECPTCGAVLSTHLGDGYFEHWEHLEVCMNPECCQRLQWQRC